MSSDDPGVEATIKPTPLLSSGEDWMSRMMAGHDACDAWHEAWDEAPLNASLELVRALVRDASISPPHQMRALQDLALRGAPEAAQMAREHITRLRPVWMAWCWREVCERIALEHLAMVAAPYVYHGEEPHRVDPIYLRRRLRVDWWRLWSEAMQPVVPKYLHRRHAEFTDSPAERLHFRPATVTLAVGGSKWQLAFDLEPRKEQVQEVEPVRVAYGQKVDAAWEALAGWVDLIEAADGRIGEVAQ